MLMTQLKTDCPEPGIYEGVPFATYDAWDALSNSGLSLLAKSPRHFHDADRSEATDAQRIGELCHCNQFEPGAFAERYAIMPPFERDPGNCTADGEPSTSKTTKYYRAKKKEFEAANAGREICPPEWYEKSITLVRELALCDRANCLLNQAGPCEVSIVWDEPTTPEPVRCKARLDKIALENRAIVDLKKCRDVTDFQKDIAYRRYHRQMAFYARGWRRLSGEYFAPWLIAHEISVPLSVLAAPLSPVAILIGQDEVDKYLNLFVECRARDEWPGPIGPPTWELPPWMLPDSEPVAASNGRETY